MITKEREEELLKITDGQVLFDTLCKELGIPKGEVLPLRLTTEKLAKYLLSLNKCPRSGADDVIEEIGFRECMEREKRRRMKE